MCFPRSEIRVARTSHRARTHGTNVAHGACEASHTAEPSTSRVRETRTRTRAAHLAPVLGESLDNGSRPPLLQSRHAGRQQGGRGGAQARRGGSRDRGGPIHARGVPRDHRAPQRIRRAHGARARDARSSVRPSPRAERLPRQRHIARLGRARAAARVPRGVSRHAARRPHVQCSPVDARARGSPRTRRYAARADRASPHSPDRTVSPDPRAWSSPRRRPPRTECPYGKKLTVRHAPTRFSPQRVQARQEEAFVQPG